MQEHGGQKTASQRTTEQTEEIIMFTTDSEDSERTDTVLDMRGGGSVTPTLVKDFPFPCGLHRQAQRGENINNDPNRGRGDGEKI